MKPTVRKLKLDGTIVSSTAFAMLCERYREQLFRTAHRITSTREDAEDAVQDTLLRAFVHLGGFEGRSNFGTWLTSITVNSALMILRKKRVSREIAINHINDSGDDDLWYEIPDHAPNPETRYAQTEEQRILKSAIPAFAAEPASRGADSPARTFDAGSSRSIRHLFASSQGATVPRQEGSPAGRPPGSWRISLDLLAS